MNEITSQRSLESEYNKLYSENITIKKRNNPDEYKFIFKINSFNENNYWSNEEMFSSFLIKCHNPAVIPYTTLIINNNRYVYIIKHIKKNIKNETIVCYVSSREIDFNNEKTKKINDIPEGYFENIYFDISFLDSNAVENENECSNLNEISLRIAEKINIKKLEIYKIQNFLTEDECTQIISTIDSTELTPSTVYNELYNKRITSNTRTSKTCYFTESDILIKDIEIRICKTMGISNSYIESIKAQKYEIGEEFRLHTDYYKHQTSLIDGQRTWTFMIYLNSVEEGGYTSFPLAYYSCAPSRGTALTWNNLNSKGEGNMSTLHCGMPIIRGTKYILTCWFRDKKTNSNIPIELYKNNHFPIFHPIGFEKMHIKLDCIDSIKAWMLQHDDKWADETFKNKNIELNTKILNINSAPKKLLTDLCDTFKDILTKWIKYKTQLMHTSTYGIRKYLRGSKLENHYDKKNNVISAIIHLRDASEKPWTLTIEDHCFRSHNITMEYGDILLYESTTCLHGRPTPFEGESFCNMYIHFRPELWM